MAPLGRRRHRRHAGLPGLLSGFLSACVGRGRAARHHLAHGPRHRRRQGLRRAASRRRPSRVEHPVALDGRAARDPTCPAASTAARAPGSDAATSPSAALPASKRRWTGSGRSSPGRWSGRRCTASPRSRLRCSRSRPARTRPRRSTWSRRPEPPIPQRALAVCSGSPTSSRGRRKLTASREYAQRGSLNPIASGDRGAQVTRGEPGDAIAPRPPAGPRAAELQREPRCAMSAGVTEQATPGELRLHLHGGACWAMNARRRRAVWEGCDGQRSVQAIGAALERGLRGLRLARSSTTWAGRCATS